MVARIIDQFDNYGGEITSKRTLGLLTVIQMQTQQRNRIRNMAVRDVLLNHKSCPNKNSGSSMADRLSISVANIANGVFCYIVFKSYGPNKHGYIASINN